jgi:hypothetical protein
MTRGHRRVAYHPERRHLLNVNFREAALSCARTSAL